MRLGSPIINNKEEYLDWLMTNGFRVFNIPKDYPVKAVYVNEKPEAARIKL